MTGANLAERLLERARLHPERTALVEYGRRRMTRLSYGELAERVARVSAGLSARGIAPGERVLLFVPMSIELYVALLGCFHAGAVAVFVDAWADRRRLDAAVAAARPRAFLGSPRAHLLRLLSPSVRRIPVRWWVGRRGVRPYERAAAGNPAPVSPNDAALVTFTTGSTGRPKAAARSHAFLWAQHRALAEHLRLRGEDVDLPTLPIFVLNNLALGITSVLPDLDPRRPTGADPARLVRQMEREGVTTSSGSPVLYDRLAAWCEAQGRALPLRALWTGGAPVSPRLAERLARVVPEAHVVYGSTEAEPISGVDARELATAAGAGVCVGVPVPGVTLKLIRPHDGPVEMGERGWAEWEVIPGEVGEVVVTGDHVLGGYLDAPDEDRRHKIRDGERVWHRTGDAARLDAGGRLWLMGRVGGRVVRAGEAWWPLPVESAALRVPGVTHAAYLGVPDPELGARALLCIEIPGGAKGRLRLRNLGAPVDELRVLRSIPRDPRHASKTDLDALRRRISKEPHRWPFG